MNSHKTLKFGITFLPQKFVCLVITFKVMSEVLLCYYLSVCGGCQFVNEFQRMIVHVLILFPLMT